MYKQFNTEISKFKLTAQEILVVEQALTVRELNIDLELVIMLLNKNVKVEDLEHCFKFLLKRGNRPTDHENIFKLLRATVPPQHLSFVL